MFEKAPQTVQAVRDFESFYRREYAGVAMVLSRNPAAAEDLAQEAFLSYAVPMRGWLLFVAMVLLAGACGSGGLAATPSSLTSTDPTPAANAQVVVPQENATTSLAAAASGTAAAVGDPPVDVLPEIPICGSYPGGHSFAGSLDFRPRDLDAYSSGHVDVWGGAVIRNTISAGDGGLLETPTIIAVVTDEVEVHRAALREVAADGAVVDVRLGSRTLAHLEGTVRQLERDLDGIEGLIRVTLHVPENQVMVEVAADSDAVRLSIANAAPAGSVCLAPYTGPVTAWGVQRQAGEGWRLLGESLRTAPYSVSAATSKPGFEAMWRRRFSGDLPEVDFGSEMVVLFGAAVSSCPEILLEGIRIDDDPPIVLPVLTRPHDSAPCRMIARGHGYAVAVERSLLPDGFVVELGVDVGDPPRMEVDLTDQDADTVRWGPVVVVTVVQPPKLERGVGFTLRFFDDTGKLVSDGTEAIEVTPDGTVLNTAADGRLRTLPGPGRYRFEFGIDRRSAGSGKLVHLGTCEESMDLAAFVEVPVRVVITHVLEPPDDGPPCRIVVGETGNE